MPDVVTPFCKHAVFKSSDPKEVCMVDVAKVLLEPFPNPPADELDEHVDEGELWEVLEVGDVLTLLGDLKVFPINGKEEVCGVAMVVPPTDISTELISNYRCSTFFIRSETNFYLAFTRKNEKMKKMKFGIKEHFMKNNTIDE